MSLQASGWNEWAILSEAENNVWAKGAIAFLEGVSEDGQ
jgi:hypothetical protein